MKLKTLITVLAATAAIASSATTTLSQSSPEQGVKFICAKSRKGNVPTTYAWTGRGKIAVIRWESKDLNAAGYTPQRRCEEVSPRFQTAYNHGSISFITNGKINNQRVICTARKVEGDCADVLLTLRPQDDSRLVLQQLNEILNGEAAGDPVAQSSSDPQVYIQTNIQQFLRTAPTEKE